MKKEKHILRTVLLMALSAATAASVTFVKLKDDYSTMLKATVQNQKDYTRFTELKDIISKHFVGEYDEKKLTEYSLSGYVYGLQDKWSYFLTAEEYAKYKQELSGNYGGIGVMVNYDEKSQALKVTQVYEGGPAARAGIKVLDMIVAVDGKKVSELGYEATVQKVKGEIGTALTLQIIKASTNKIENISLTREIVHKNSVTSKMLDNKIGYVKITDFFEKSGDEFKKEVNSLISNGATSLMFDVRFNPGGSKDEMVKMLDMLLGEGVIFTEENKDGEKHQDKSDANKINLPMVVLTNEYSISAAEFFAAALKDYNAAKIVGEKTTGKGYGQQTIELSEETGGGAVVLSTIKYYTPKGISLANVGLTPDYEVKMTEQDKNNFESLTLTADIQIQSGISILKGIPLNIPQKQAEINN